MRTATMREFRDHATEMFRAEEPILVMRRGELAGIFFPHPSTSLPVELKSGLYAQLIAQVARHLRRRGVREVDVMEDFRAWRGAGREARRGR